jgi:hypothetical protein
VDTEKLYIGYKLYIGSFSPCFNKKMQVRGFAPIGMLECWNIGRMDFGILECWVNGTNRLDDKIKNG